MKNLRFNTFYALALLISFVFLLSCGDDEEGSTPTFAAPHITVTVPDGGLTPEVGATVTLSIAVSAEAGLSGLFLNNNNINTFSGTENSSTVTYDQLVSNLNPITLNFTIEDAQGTRVNADPITLNPVEGINLGFLLVDFSGTSSGNQEKTVADWDIRTKWDMSVTAEIGASATLENVAGQGTVVQFAASNPDPNESVRVLRYSKAQGATSTGPWGGWTNLIIGLSGNVPENEINALPKYDPISNSLTGGTKVVAVDVYYDDTIDPDFSWSDVLGFTDVWNSDPSNGFKLDLVLGAYANHADVEVGYDQQGYHISYSAYIPEPNKWVTVTFDLLDEGRTAFFYDNRDEENSSNAVPANQVNCFNIKASPGYDAQSGGDGIDTNHLYFKNLRIIDKE